ncbi:MAG: RNA polymerase sigma factor [Planctomycetota bacterium]
MVSDDRIVAQVVAGKTSEFRKLVEQYRQPVFRFTRNLIGDEHDAEDVTQEVFLAAFDGLVSYNAKRASFLTWLFTIARNRCVNYLKRKRPVIGGEVIADTLAALTGDDVTRIEFWRHLDRALDELPIEQKTAFVLAEIEGLTYADIAQIENAAIGTVKSRIHRAKQRLRAVMEPSWESSHGQ